MISIEYRDQVLTWRIKKYENCLWIDWFQNLISSFSILEDFFILQSSMNFQIRFSNNLLQIKPLRYIKKHQSNFKHANHYFNIPNKKGGKNILLIFVP